ncbi:MAG TPA: pantoate--beta-alanine ligase [Gemmatimonadales bacterium]|nr:pantoate--beta-alanine ligase [Gemmatimonadales bacterium]
MTTAPAAVMREVPRLRQWVAAQRAAGRRIGLVPTMGALHEGHLALVDALRPVTDRVVMSIFVNPLQFGPGEDLERYPRDLDRDRQLAGSRGVDLVFAPEVRTMYPPGAETRVVPGETAERWEGANRPGHFVGVLTVVAKLFHLVQPDVAAFGQKDVQQITLIRRMVRDLDWPIELVVAPTVREPDCLAMSSRNQYLDPAERQQALGLSAALRAAHQAWSAGERSAAAIERAMRERLEVFPGLVADYIAITDPDHLRPVDTVDAATVVALAGRVGDTRLIDNIILGDGLVGCSAT